MFTKYLNQFQKAEAEWVMEVIDMHDGDYDKAVAAIGGALERLTERKPKIEELKDFDRTIEGAFRINRDWWLTGLDRLEVLGKYKRPAPPKSFADLGRNPEIEEHVKSFGRLQDTKGMIIEQRYLDARRSGAIGRALFAVPGHGGELWYVIHDDGYEACYLLNEITPVA